LNVKRGVLLRYARDVEVSTVFDLNEFSLNHALDSQPMLELIATKIVKAYNITSCMNAGFLLCSHAIYLYIELCSNLKYVARCDPGE